MKKVLWNGAVIGFLAMNITLGIRSLTLEDARLGWGMFSYQTNYTVKYAWINEDGSVREQPARDLRGRTHKYLGDDKSHRTRYGRGGIRGWMQSYCRHMYETHKPSDAVAFRALVTYRINKGRVQQLTVRYPQEQDS